MNDNLFHASGVANRDEARRWLFSEEAAGSQRWQAAMANIEREMWLMTGECVENMDDARLVVETWLNDAVEGREEVSRCSKEVEEAVNRDVAELQSEAMLNEVSELV